ncbi:hypothetical protein DFH06DRAFT_1369783 [Mycena polygramma]|nr:hypothetical protein DFH06DRAFT_1369783 [Mycena polygramma]
MLPSGAHQGTVVLSFATQPQSQEREGVPQDHTARAKALTLSDLHALVLSLEARLVAQDEKITVLERENSELWKEVHRLKGPRFPREIFAMIVESARDDKKALTTFSLVCKSWMPITRNILFSRISSNAMFWLVKIELGPILNGPHCTVFPHVQTITVGDGDVSARQGHVGGDVEDDGSPEFAFREDTWMDDIFVHMPNFTALKALELYTLGLGDLDAIDRALSLSTKRAIRRLDLYHLEDLILSEIADFISKFTDLTTLQCGDMCRSWEQDSDGSTDFATDELLVAPPSSITKLDITPDTPEYLAWDPSSVLKWFTDFHRGIIESVIPGNLPVSHPAEFERFINRFGCSLSHIKLSGFSNNEHAGYLRTLSQLKSIALVALEPAFECLPQMFAQLPPSTEEITLFLTYFWDCEDLSQRECPATWREVDRTLTETKFSSLRCLSIVCNGMQTGKENRTRRILQTFFPRIEKKRFLRIDFERLIWYMHTAFSFFTCR